MNSPGVIYWSEMFRLSLKIKEEAYRKDGGELQADLLKELADGIAETNQLILEKEKDK